MSQNQKTQQSANTNIDAEKKQSDFFAQCIRRFHLEPLLDLRLTERNASDLFNAYLNVYRSSENKNAKRSDDWDKYCVQQFLIDIQKAYSQPLIIPNECLDKVMSEMILNAESPDTISQIEFKSFAVFLQERPLKYLHELIVSTFKTTDFRFMFIVTIDTRRHHIQHGLSNENQSGVQSNVSATKSSSYEVLDRDTLLEVLCSEFNKVNLICDKLNDKNKNTDSETSKRPFKLLQFSCFDHRPNAPKYQVLMVFESTEKEQIFEDDKSVFSGPGFRLSCPTYIQSEGQGGDQRQGQGNVNLNEKEKENEAKLTSNDLFDTILALYERELKQYFNVFEICRYTSDPNNLNFVRFPASKYCFGPSDHSLTAEFAAKGVLLGQEALSKAKAIDQEYKITETLADSVRNLVTTLDDTMNISQTAESIKQSVGMQAKDLNEKHQISQRANETIDQIDTTFNVSENVRKAQQGLKSAASAITSSDTFKSGLGVLSRFSSSIASAVNNFQQETLDICYEQKQEQQQNNNQHNQSFQQNSNQASNASKSTSSSSTSQSSSNSGSNVNPTIVSRTSEKPSAPSSEPQ